MKVNSYLTIAIDYKNESDKWSPYIGQPLLGAKVVGVSFKNPYEVIDQLESKIKSLEDKLHPL